MKAIFIIFVTSVIVLIISLAIELIVYKGIEKAPEDSTLAWVRNFSILISGLLFFLILMCIFG